jgi:hypothetical protein
VPIPRLLKVRKSPQSCCTLPTLFSSGPGGPVPYRIYVDSGVVFLCVVALAPVSPLVAVAGLLYFLLFSPMLRWLLIFVYRPEYDGGGQRWPLIFEIFMSAMILAQVRLFYGNLPCRNMIQLRSHKVNLTFPAYCVPLVDFSVYHDDTEKSSRPRLAGGLCFDSDSVFSCDDKSKISSGISRCRPSTDK